MTVTFVQIGVSPWSEKARWALDHHGVAYRKIEYLPMIGEPWLRLRLGKLSGSATVPVLIDRDQIFTDSWSIARHAEAVGMGAPLFPPDAFERIRDCDERSERILAAGRARTAARTLESPEALRDALPPPLRHLGPASLPLAKLGARFIQKKYATDANALEAHHATMRDELAALREALAEREYLWGDGFSYADIAMACSLQFVAPIEIGGAPVGHGSRFAWSEPDLAREFEDLVAWRDRLYARHR